MSNRLFSEDGPNSELPCMDCLRVEMGEKGCYNGEEQQHSNMTRLLVFSTIKGFELAFRIECHL